MLERGEVANSWRHERWDSLRLLTPNWQSRLPGYRYDGADPDGFMTMPEVIDFIDRYARVHRRAGAHRHHGEFGAEADERISRGHRSRRVALPRGRAGERRAQLAGVPPLAPRAAGVGRARSRRRNTAIRISSTMRGVLVVGASATGVQLADEIHAFGARR